MSAALTSSDADLQIIGAVYGLAKVTSKVISLVDRNTTPQSLKVNASNDVFGDSWYGYRKTLTVAYRYGSTGTVRVKVVKETETLTISRPEYEVALAAGPDSLGSPKLSVLAATYGPSDVTQVLRGKIDGPAQALKVVADNNTFGPDPWYGFRKNLVVVAAYTDQVPFVDIVQETFPYTLKYRPPLQIISAYWGLMDVTERVRSEVWRRSLTIRADNSVFGDGWYGVGKTLDVVYQYGREQEQLAVVTEGNTLTIDYLPKPPRAPSPDPQSLNVIRAAYGPRDVTDKARAMIASQSLDFVPQVAFPGYGDHQSFALTYSWGPAEPQSLVRAGDARVSLHQPPVTRLLQDIIPLTGLIAEGDRLSFRAGNDSYLAPDPTGQLRANIATRTPETAFTVALVPGQPAQITLKDSNGRPVIVDKTTGTLTVAPDPSTAEPARLFLSMVRSGSVNIGVLGSSRNFSIVQQDASILAGGTDITTFDASYTVELDPTQEGLNNHLRLYGMTDVELPSRELLTLVWDLTGGFFAAIGLGPLLAGSDTIKVGVVALIKSNPVTAAALNKILNTVMNNPEASMTVGMLFSFAGAMWDAGIMLSILRMLLDFGWGLAMGVAIVWVAAKVLEWTILPEAALAELAASFAKWAYDTTMHALAYINSINGSKRLSNTAVGLPPLPTAT